MRALIDPHALLWHIEENSTYRYSHSSKAANHWFTQSVA